MTVTCDFCNPAVEIPEGEGWYYPCDDFILTILKGPVRSIVNWSRGPWAACETHADVLNSPHDNRRKVRLLVNTTRPGIEAKYGQHSVAAHLMVMQLGAVYGNFLRYRRYGHRPMTNEDREMLTENKVENLNWRLV